MNKQAYFKMMGMHKIAAPTAQGGYLDNIKRVYNMAQAATKDNVGQIMRGIGNAYGAQGEMGTWAWLWNTIKSWFGDKDAIKALQAYTKRNTNINAAQNRLKTWYDNVAKTMPTEQDKDTLAQHITSARDRYARRGRQALSKANQIYSKLPKGTKVLPQDLRNYYFGRGQQNARQDIAPKGTLTVPNATKQEMNIIAPAGVDMASVRPSWRDQLGGGTAAV